MWSRVVPWLLAALFAPASAFAVSVGTYILSSHPDGNQNPPPYGLRLDGLLTGSSGEEYTFDFNHASSDMKLTWNGSMIHIFGTAFGGEDNGAGYAPSTTAVWTIDFTYNAGVSTSANGGVDDVVVNAHHQNFGTLSGALGDFALRDHTDGVLSFTFGDEDGSGHREFNGISGWGWLDYCNTDVHECAQDGTDWVPTHITASDWLFTATPVPVPAAVWLFGSGLIGLACIARRRKAA